MCTALTFVKGEHPWQDDEIKQVDYEKVELGVIFMFYKELWEVVLISVSVPALVVAVIGFSAYVSCKDWSD